MSVRNQRNIRSVVLFFGLAVLIVVSCQNGDVVSTESRAHYSHTWTVHIPRASKIDLLLVIDSSWSSAEEQESIANKTRGLVSELIAPVDFMDDAARDVRLGMISSDFEILAGEKNPGCSEIFGRGDCGVGGCAWLSYHEESTPFMEFLSCIPDPDLMSSGAGQHFEASLQALTTFSGPGEPFNGFLRDDSWLVIIYISRTDDCSRHSSFEPSDSNPHTDCINNEELLNPTSEYVEKLTNIREMDDSKFVVAAVVGIPTDDSWRPGDTLDELRELRSGWQGDPSLPSMACETQELGAYFGLRFVEFAYKFEGLGELFSLCQEDWSPILRVIRRRVSDPYYPLCTDRIIPYALSSCRLIQTLRDDSACPGLADRADGQRTTGWSIDLGVEDGMRSCEILQVDLDGDSVPEPNLDGWYWDYREAPDCPYGQFAVTFADDGNSWFRMACFHRSCPSHRHCPEAVGGLSCDSEPCPEGYTCMFLENDEICGSFYPYEERTCSRCIPTIGISAEHREIWPESRWSEPLIGYGGCCASGFSCSDDECVPDV